MQEATITFTVKTHHQAQRLVLLNMIQNHPIDADLHVDYDDALELVEFIVDFACPAASHKSTPYWEEQHPDYTENEDTMRPIILRLVDYFVTAASHYEK